MDMLLHSYTLTICTEHCVDANGLCRHLIDISEMLGFVLAQMWFRTKRIVGNTGSYHRNGWTGLQIDGFMGCLSFHCMTLTALIKSDKWSPHESNMTSE